MNMCASARPKSDPYSEIEYAWTFARANRVADFKVKGKTDPASLETLESVFFTFKNPEFPGRGTTRSVLIPATGRNLKFTFWLQPGKAPVVYIVPGLGSHRLAETSLALAELAYNNGFSAVKHQQPFQPRIHGKRLDGGAAGVSAGGRTRCARRADAKLITVCMQSIPDGWVTGRCWVIPWARFESLFIAATRADESIFRRDTGAVLRFLQGKAGVKEVRIAARHEPVAADSF